MSARPLSATEVAAAIVAIVEEKGTDRIAVRLALPDRTIPPVVDVSVATYRDGGEETHVIYLKART